MALVLGHNLGEHFQEDSTSILQAVENLYGFEKIEGNTIQDLTVIYGFLTDEINKKYTYIIPQSLEIDSLFGPSQENYISDEIIEQGKIIMFRLSGNINFNEQ